MHPAIASLLLQPIVRVSLASTIKPYPFSRLFHTYIHGNGASQSQTLLNALKLRLLGNVTKPYWNLIFPISHQFPARISRISGGKCAINVLLGLSVVVGSWPSIAHCTNGFSFVANDHDYSVSWDSESDDDEDHRTLGAALRKFMLPVFFLTTILMNWGQPIVIAAKIILILYGSKPSPFSVYFAIEKLQKQARLQLPIIFRDSGHYSSYAQKVEVEDYVFFCFARTELNDQNLTLVGILGSWWVLPLHL